MKRQPSFPLPDDKLPLSKKLRASPSPSLPPRSSLNTNEPSPNKEQPSEYQEPRPEFVNWSPVIRELRLRREPPCFTEMNTLGALITMQLAIAEDKRFPPPYELNKTDLSSLQQEFGETVIDELDALVAKLTPAPDQIGDLQASVEEFDADPTGKEIQVAGSPFDRSVNPFERRRIQRAHGQRSILVRMSQQGNLYAVKERDNTRVYIYPDSSDMDNYVSGTRKYDHSYSLMKTACDQTTTKELGGEALVNHFPCFSSDRTSLPPFVTGEVKVLGHYRKQREQQEIYATFYITSWMMLRALMMKQTTSSPSVDDLLQGISHCCFSMSPCSLEIWYYRPTIVDTTGAFEIQSRLLCSGHPCDEGYVKEIYIPWRRYVMKRGIINQILYLVPAIQAYAQLPKPRPFSRSGPLFILSGDLQPGSYNLKGPSFSTTLSPERRLLEQQFLAHEEEERHKKKARKRKNTEEVTITTVVQTATETPE